MSESSRKKKEQDPRLRVAAARTLIDARDGDEALAMAAFMGIFHPGHPKTDELVRDAKKKKR